MSCYSEDVVVMDNVELAADGLVAVCEVDGRRFGVPTSAFRPGTTIRKRGDRGRLVISLVLAERLGVSPMRTFSGMLGQRSPSQLSGSILIGPSDAGVGRSLPP